MQNKNIGKSIKLKPLRPNVGLAVEFYEPQKRLIEKMYLDVKKQNLVMQWTRQFLANQEFL